MIVKDAKEIARRWVMEEASKYAGFQGAFYHGSVNWLSDDELLASSSDVDIMVVFSDPPAMKLGKFIYQDVMLEVSHLGWDQLQSAEQILGQYHMAGSFKGLSIMADPTGRLTELQMGVSFGYAKQNWISKRCETAQNKVLAGIQNLEATAPLHDQVNTCTFSAGVMTHVLLVAGLKNPTVRRRYSAVRALLTEYDQLDFYETLLEMLGCHQMDRARVEHHLVAVTAAFDSAKELLKTPYNFAADLSDIARPVAIDGSRELIERGYHREAIFWMVATYSRCQWVFHHDASAEIQAQFNTGYHELLTDLGIRSFADRVQRCQQIRDYLPDVWEMAKTIMAANPEIE